MPRESHLPFTVSARRLVALQATLLEWHAALAPHHDGEFAPLLRSVEGCMSACRDSIVRMNSVTRVDSARGQLAVAVSTYPIYTLDEAAKLVGNRRTAQIYLSAFVDEGWVLRVKPGVYKLNIP